MRVISCCTLQSRIRFPPLCHFELLSLFEMGFVYESRAQMRLIDASAKKQRIKYSWRCHFNGVTAYIICTTVRTDVDLLQFPELAPDDSASCMYISPLHHNLGRSSRIFATAMMHLLNLISTPASCSHSKDPAVV